MYSVEKKEKRRKGTLLKACDELRDGLQISGIQVQVSVQCREEGEEEERYPVEGVR